MGLKAVNPSLVSEGLDAGYKWATPSEHQAQFKRHGNLQAFNPRKPDPNRHFRSRPAYNHNCYNGKCLSSVNLPINTFPSWPCPDACTEWTADHLKHVNGLGRTKSMATNPGVGGRRFCGIGQTMSGLPCRVWEEGSGGIMGRRGVPQSTRRPYSNGEILSSRRTPRSSRSVPGVAVPQMCHGSLIDRPVTSASQHDTSRGFQTNRPGTTSSQASRMQLPISELGSLSSWPGSSNVIKAVDDAITPDGIIHDELEQIAAKRKQIQRERIRIRRSIEEANES